jgi:hypothetical protein
LDNWLDQIIVAESLAQIERLATGKSDNTWIKSMLILM